MLQQAQVDLVVTQDPIEKNLSWSENIQCLCVEYNPQILEQIPLEPLHQPSDLAYIIYK